MDSQNTSIDGYIDSGNSTAHDLATSGFTSSAAWYIDSPQPNSIYNGSVYSVKKKQEMDPREAHMAYTKTEIDLKLENASLTTKNAIYESEQNILKEIRALSNDLKKVDVIEAKIEPLLGLKKTIITTAITSVLTVLGAVGFLSYKPLSQPEKTTAISQPEASTPKNNAP